MAQDEKETQRILWKEMTGGENYSVLYLYLLEFKQFKEKYAFLIEIYKIKDY